MLFYAYLLEWPTTNFDPSNYYVMSPNSPQTSFTFFQPRIRKMKMALHDLIFVEGLYIKKLHESDKVVIFYTTYFFQHFINTPIPD